ncbi:cytochrome P450 [Mycotypha africana]|uniref:cytochrome P450 n=1 Tax=Mycotypha africana TaxID=64632 RepID=UPI002301049E|nr:cytochrome P450 [Mycotypha africana]KAI8991429.1 cytochrome P450 [Mycotypha africana]
MDYQAVQKAVKQYIDKYIPATAVGHQQQFDYSALRKIALKVGVSTAVVYFIFNVIIYRLYLHPLRKMPGPKKLSSKFLPFLGNYPEVVKEKETGQVMNKWAKQFGGILAFYGPWNRPRVLVTDDQLLKQVLTTREYDFVKTPEASRFLKGILGNGVLLAEGAAHRLQRKMLNPAFSVNNIRAFVPLMAKPGYQLRSKWLDVIKGKENKVKRQTNDDGIIAADSNQEEQEEETFTELEVSSGLSLAALDVIGWALGEDFKSLESAGTHHQSKLSQAYLHIFSNDMSMMRILAFIFPFLSKLPTERNRRIKRDLKWLEEESRALVQRGMNRVAKAKAVGINLNHPANNRHKDLLTTMIELVDDDTGKGLTLEEIRNQCLTFLAAGHETTSVSLSWCLWLLAQYQQIQDNLRAEVRTLFKEHDNNDGDINNVPTYDEINALPLLNNVVRETLRLIPPVPYTSRITRVPCRFGFIFVFLNILGNHHSETIWGEDAKEFNPYRWEEGSGRPLGNAYQYMPFLAGGRQCIGYKFALVEFKLLLAILIKDIQYFEKPGFQVTKKQQLTLRPFPNMQLWAKAI